MADKTGEQLSALVDCECDAAELDLALRRLAKDEGLKARWQRYHLIGDAVKNNLPEVLDARFSERIRQAIEASPPIHKAPSASPSPAWYKPVAGFGLAASVALVTVLALESPFSPEVNSDLRVTGGEPAPAFLPESPGAEALAGAALAGEAQARLAGYLVNHNEYASMNSARGVLPYVYMVGYQTNP